MKNAMKSQSGFSLVELMVVVAIIGILATMSVSAVQKQIAKARQSEVKTNLGGLYTSQKSFHSEFNTYWSNMRAINYSLEGNLRYNIVMTQAPAALVLANFGHPNAAAFPAAQKVRTGTGAEANAAAVLCGNNGGTAAIPCRSLADAIAPGAAPAAVAQNTFEAVGASALYKGNEDRWLINERKILTNPAAALAVD